jgi:hypothetical protein
MKNYLHKNSHPILRAIDRLHKILLPKIPKGNMKAKKNLVLLGKFDFF